MKTGGHEDTLTAGEDAALEAAEEIADRGQLVTPMRLTAELGITLRRAMKYHARLKALGVLPDSGKAIRQRRAIA